MRRLILLAFIAFLIAFIFQHFAVDLPFRALLWNEEIVGPLVAQLLGMSWAEWVANPQMDTMITRAQYICGCLLFLLGLLSLFFIRKKYNRLAFYPLLILSVYIFLISLLKYISKGYQIAQLIEHMMQWMLPIALYYIYFNRKLLASKWLKLACAFTFLGHGLYAIGLHPIPGNFMYMVMDGFGFTEQYSVVFLSVVGIIDILAAVALFSKNNSLIKYALLWMILWGFLTALARLTVQVDLDYFSAGLGRWWYEFVIRIPHFLVPLYLYLDSRKL